MGHPATPPAKKRVLILSDNDGLSRAIALNLKQYLEVEVIRWATQTPACRSFADGAPTDDVHFDLLVVAMSSSSHEPLVALSRATLTQHVGRVPLLIISDRPFESEPEDRIAHLDFPFDIDRLRTKVVEILEMSQ